MRHRGGFKIKISRRLAPRATRKRKQNTHTHLSHAEQINNIGESPLLTHAHSKNKAATCVDHGEMIAIDSDVNAKYDNSRDREDDVRAGGGAGDEVNKMSRCVYALRIFMFGTGDIAVVVEGNVNTDGSRAKTD